MIFARRPAPNETDTGLVRVPVDGGEPTVILRTAAVNQIGLSPDGRWASFQSGE